MMSGIDLSEKTKRIIAIVAAGLSSEEVSFDEVRDFLNAPFLDQLLWQTIQIAQHGNTVSFLVAAEMISEAREIFGEEAAQQLMAKLAQKHGESRS